MEEENISSAISESNILPNDLIKVDYTNNPEFYFISCDIFCLPSYREGFGNVVLEASSTSKPVIASDIYGLKDIVEKIQFDSFYHEHLRTYSLKSLIKLLNYYKLNIVDAYTTERYNGNIQAHFSKNKYLKNNINIKVILKKEDKAKLDNPLTYQIFSNKVEKAKKELFTFLNKNPKALIVGKSYPARASVILNYFSFLKDKLKFIAEHPT